MSDLTSLATGVFLSQGPAAISKRAPFIPDVNWTNLNKADNQLREWNEQERVRLLTAIHTLDKILPTADPHRKVLFSKLIFPLSNRSQLLGEFDPNRPDRIFINRAALDNPVKLVSVLAHEFDHALNDLKLPNSEKDKFERERRAYGDWGTKLFSFLETGLKSYPGSPDEKRSWGNDLVRYRREAQSLAARQTVGIDLLECRAIANELADNEAVSPNFRQLLQLSSILLAIDPHILLKPEGVKRFFFDVNLFGMAGTAMSVNQDPIAMTRILSRLSGGYVRWMNNLSTYETLLQ